jgi:5'-nucleotidase
MVASSFQTRRDFLKFTLGTTAMLYGFNADAREALSEKGVEELCILYTNDQHSRIEPFPANDPKFANEGGFAKRAAVIEQLRKEHKNILLLDAGDIFQGTPYFNYYHGELEYKLMSIMGYDATTFGNHDFDLGTENLIQQFPHASFDFINCNYDFSNSALHHHKKISPYKIYKRGRLKIGVLGVGIQLKDLVDQKYCEGIQYRNPVEYANNISTILKKDEKCDYIICLSHLGYKYDSGKICDTLFAEQTKYIDLIIGGHTHTFLEEPSVHKNAEGLAVQVTQVGWAGIWLGKIDLLFSDYTKKIIQNNDSRTI